VISVYIVYTYGPLTAIV